MEKKQGNFWAECLGHGLAHVQNTFDCTLEWGFKRLRRFGETEPPKKKGNPYLQGAKKITKGALFFLGDIGDSFYTKYAELKRRGKENT